MMQSSDRRKRLDNIQREQMLVDAHAYFDRRYAKMCVNRIGAPMTDEELRLHKLGMWKRISQRIERRFK